MNNNLPSFESARVLVVGDLMLDRYWHGSTSTISPEAPVPVVRVGDEEERPGGAANVALNVVTLGARVTVVGLTGDDAAADTLTRLLEREGVTCQFVRSAEVSTISKLRIISRQQQLLRLDFEKYFQHVGQTNLQQVFEQQLPEHDIVILSDYRKGTLDLARELIVSARAAGKPVLVDPKGQDFSLYSGSTLITPNETEFEQVVGECNNDSELVQRGESLMQELDLQALLVTRSEKGMTLMQRGQPAVHLPARAREVYDVTGAGDTVISVLAASLSAGHTLEQSTALANTAAGVVVGKLGTASVSVYELMRAVLEEKEVMAGLVDEDQLQQLVQEAKTKGERIVMTNGCFDILHAGHVAHLREARKLGDRLIVAVNDDDSVKRLKGKNRPINTLALRMEVLAALESVDFVVPFSEDTPERLICKILPDLLVKGSDYRPEDIAGAGCVIDHGGEVAVLDFVDGCSTSRIIDVIRKQPIDD